MDFSSDTIPEEFVDPLVNEFAYDPIRLPLTEDPAQVLYNRKTLEKIWDSKQTATNPYTRSPFDIHSVIPQTELKQQMRQYIINKNRSALEVIPADYTEPLNSTDMKYLLTELVRAGEHCLVAGESNNKNESEASWKVLWQKLNLLRLYCQYTAENRETFLSIKGYEYLLNVINPSLWPLSFRYSSAIEDTKEACKEVAKILDVVVLKDSDLAAVPRANITALLQILAELLKSEDLKIQSMVLRIYRGMCDNCAEYVLRRRANIFSILGFYFAPRLLLLRGNTTDITNEDLYNTSALLEAAWIRNRSVNAPDYYVDGVVKVVIICISRFQALHASITPPAQAHGQASFMISGHENQIQEEEGNDINMITRSLERGLFLIDCIVMHSNVNRYPIVLEWKQRLQTFDIVKDIVGMVEHVLEGCNFFQPSHLLFGFKITAALCREEDSVSVITRNNVVRVFGEFLGSDFVNEYDTKVNLLLQDIVHSAS